MKIELDQWNCCVSSTCPFRSECAQHKTAGDFRSEDGFRPELRCVGNEFFCETADQELNEKWLHIGNFPINFHYISSGALSKKDLAELSSNNFSI